MAERSRAEAADRRVERAEHGLRVLGYLSATVVVLALVASTTFSALAAQSAKQATKENHSTGLQNSQILQKISSAQNRHSQTIIKIAALQHDLDRKFALVIQAACQNNMSAACVELQRDSR